MSEASSDVRGPPAFDWDEKVRKEEEQNSAKESISLEGELSPRCSLSSQIEVGVFHCCAP